MAKASRRLPPSQRGNRALRAKPEDRYDPNKIDFVAMHEAGHAVAAVVLGIGLEWVDVTRRTMPDGSTSLGYTKTTPRHVEELNGIGEDAVIPYMAQLYSGVVSESLIHPEAFETGAHRADVSEAYSLAVLAIGLAAPDGNGKLVATPEALAENKERLGIIAERAAERAEDLINEHRASVEEIAQLLISRSRVGERVEGAEVVKAVRRTRMIRPESIAMTGQIS